VKGRVEGDQAIGWHSEFPGEPHIAMALPARLADVSVVDSGVFVGVLENAMFAVAIGTQRSIGDTARQGAAVDAVAKLIHNVGMADAARVRHRRAKRLGLGRQKFVGVAVAHAATGCAFIAVFPGSSVDAAGIVACLIHVAGRAQWFGQVGRMWIFPVVIMTGFASQPRVRALLEFLGLLVAGSAFQAGPIRGAETATDRSPKNT
jgi:hypothetical protein